MYFCSYSHRFLSLGGCHLRAAKSNVRTASLPGQFVDHHHALLPHGHHGAHRRRGSGRHRKSNYKNSASRPGRGLLSIAAYKSIRYVLCSPVRPAHIFCVRYRSFLPGLVAEFPTVQYSSFVRASADAFFRVWRLCCPILQ
jgi:hypothetical protein